MTLLRRRSAPAAAPAQRTINKPRDGVLMMRRVELKSSAETPYWYFETRTNHDAIMKMVNASRPRGNPDLYHVVDGYVSH